MRLNRREAVARGIALAGLAGAPARGTATGFSDAAYARAIVLDGLGGFGDPYGKEDDARFSARGAAELRQSGTTAIHLTVNEVGNEPGTWDKTIANMAQLDQIVADNGDLPSSATPPSRGSRRRSCCSTSAMAASGRSLKRSPPPHGHQSSAIPVPAPSTTIHETSATPKCARAQ